MYQTPPNNENHSINSCKTFYTSKQLDREISLNTQNEYSRFSKQKQLRILEDDYYKNAGDFEPYERCHPAVSWLYALWNKLFRDRLDLYLCADNGEKNVKATIRSKLKLKNGFESEKNFYRFWRYKNCSPNISPKTAIVDQLRSSQLGTKSPID